MRDLEAAKTPGMAHLGNEDVNNMTWVICDMTIGQAVINGTLATVPAIK